MRLLKILIPILLISGCKPAGVPVFIQNDIDSIAHKWVPDVREGICTVDLKILPKNGILVKGETNLADAKADIINYFAKTGLTVIDSLTLIPGMSGIKKTWGLVTICATNIKRSSSHSSELLSQAIMGTPVKILKKRGGWLLIQTPDYYIGWVEGSGVSELDDDEISAWKRSDRIIYTSKSGDILSETNDNDVVSDIVAGSIVQSEAEKGNFFLVLLPDGRRGRIIKKEAVNFKQWCSSISPQANKMILFAKSLTGTSYLWGGTSTKAADCSGFVKTIYFTGGIILARDASLQYRHGQSVDISSPIKNLEPGDLLFFGHLSKGEKRITHVGMYIGDTEFIHSSGMVRTSSLDSTRTNFSSALRENLMGARRIIGCKSERGIEAVAENSWYNIKN